MAEAKRTCGGCVHYAPQLNRKTRGACMHPDTALEREDGIIEAYPKVFRTDVCEAWTTDIPEEEETDDELLE